jgi:ABC-type lipoprotein export system ATPase subunit
MTTTGNQESSNLRLAALNNVSKSYLPDKTAGKKSEKIPETKVLDGITLTIAERDSMAIVGPSGSGKSTLLNLIGCLDRPDSGQVVINGSDTRHLSENQLSDLRNRFIGFVFQMHHLLPQLSVIDNVLLPVLPGTDHNTRLKARDHAMELLEKAGIASYYRKHPYRLSVGECQRAAVVRALVNRPRLVLADEPTGSLDAANASVLGDILLNLTKEEATALVVVTHSTELASRMDKIYRLGAGKLTPAGK